MTNPAIVTAEIKREVLETNGESIVIETSLLGPVGPAGKDGADPTAAIDAHNTDTTEVHGIADTSQLTTFEDVKAFVNALLNGAPAALDTLKEIADRIEIGESELEALVGVVAGKAPLVHAHTQADITGLVEALAAKADASALPIIKALGANVGPISKQLSLQPVTGLGLPIGASPTEQWHVDYWLLVEAANTTMDVKLGFSSSPAGCTGLWGAVTGNTSSTAGWGAVAVGSIPGALASLSTEVSFGGRTGIAAIPLHAVIYGGGNAGNVQLGYAQNTEDAGNLSIVKGSALVARRVAS